MPTKATGRKAWWRVSGHVVACSGDGAHVDSKRGPFRGLLQSCRQHCTLHHGSVPGTPWDTHLKKPTFVKDLAGNKTALRPIRPAHSRHTNAPALDQRILSQAQPQAAHLLILTLPAKEAEIQWLILCNRP